MEAKQLNKELIAMQALLDEQDYQVIADKVLDLIKEDYDLVPKQ